MIYKMDIKITLQMEHVAGFKASLTRNRAEPGQRFAFRNENSIATR